MADALGHVARHLCRHAVCYHVQHQGQKGHNYHGNAPEKHGAHIRRGNYYVDDVFKYIGVTGKHIRIGVASFLVGSKGL